jgi:hypothetical protein
MEEKYNLNENWLGHDMNTFTGRYIHFARVVDARNAQYSDKTLYDFKAAVDSYVAKADAHGNVLLTKEQIEEFKFKKTVLSSSWHPDTNSPIPYPMRTSAFLQANIPIFAGMLLSAPTPFNTMFWQWLN